MTWTQWYSFKEIFEYYGFIDEKNSGEGTDYSYLGKTGKRHEDDGFRLRSKARFSSRLMPLEGPSLTDLLCPISDNPIVGCYFIRIQYDSRHYDYIGKSSDVNYGIRKRLTSHFRKLCNIPGKSSEIQWRTGIRGLKTTEQFEKISKQIETDLKLDISDPKSLFFQNHVFIKFIPINPLRRESILQIHRIEGMALQAYKNKYGHFPILNSRDETIGIENLFG